MKSSHKEHKQHTFDSFCRTILRNEARDHYDQMRRQRNRETSLSEISPQELAQLVTTDNYPSETSTFYVIGYPISVDNNQIAEAIATLSNDRRNIILMSYFLDMTDREIAKTLNMVRRTVHHKRTSTLKKIKKIMEGKNDE